MSVREEVDYRSATANLFKFANISMIGIVSLFLKMVLPFKGRVISCVNRPRVQYICTAIRTLLGNFAVLIGNLMIF